jgi:hypothetical protein
MPKGQTGTPYFYETSAKDIALPVALEMRVGNRFLVDRELRHMYGFIKVH